MSNQLQFILHFQLFMLDLSLSSNNYCKLQYTKNPNLSKLSQLLIVMLSIYKQDYVQYQHSNDMVQLNHGRYHASHAFSFWVAPVMILLEFLLGAINLAPRSASLLRLRNNKWQVFFWSFNPIHCNSFFHYPL